MDKETGFISHLAELRKRLIHSIICLTILFVFCYFFSEYIYGFLVSPYAEAVKDDSLSRRLIFTALHETFITYLKVAFFAAIFCGERPTFRSLRPFFASSFFLSAALAALFLFSLATQRRSFSSSSFQRASSSCCGPRNPSRPRGFQSRREQ